MVECSLHGSDHEPRQCPGRTLPENTIGGRLQRYEALKAERDQWEQACKQASESYQQARAERDRYREALEKARKDRKSVV